MLFAEKRIDLHYDAKRGGRRPSKDFGAEFFHETLLREEGKIGYTKTNITIVERMDPP